MAGSDQQWQEVVGVALTDVLVQPFMPNRAVVALDIGVLLGLAGLDVEDGNSLS
jgi:hypothetical protein